MTDTVEIKQNTRQLEQHIKSAVEALVPDVFDKLDLSLPQAQRPLPPRISEVAPVEFKFTMEKLE